MHCPFALPRSLFWAFHLHSTEAEVKAPGGERMGSASLGLVQRPPTWGCEESTCVVCSLLWSEWRNSLLSQRKIIFFTSQTHFFFFHSSICWCSTVCQTPFKALESHQTKQTRIPRLYFLQRETEYPINLSKFIVYRKVKSDLEKQEGWKGGPGD